MFFLSYLLFSLLYKLILLDLFYYYLVGKMLLLPWNYIVPFYLFFHLDSKNAWNLTIKLINDFWEKGFADKGKKQEEKKYNNNIQKLAHGFLFYFIHFLFFKPKRQMLPLYRVRKGSSAYVWRLLETFFFWHVMTLKLSYTWLRIVINIKIILFLSWYIEHIIYVI